MFCNGKYLNGSFLSDLTSNHCGQFVAYPCIKENRINKIIYRPLNSNQLLNFSYNISYFSVYAMKKINFDPKFNDNVKNYSFFRKSFTMAKS